METNEESVVLNRRKHLRYYINKVAVGAPGSIVEISSRGARLKKNKAEMFEKPEMVIPIAGRQLKVRVVWQDDKQAGLAFLTPFDDWQYIQKNVKRLKDASFRAQNKLSDEAVTEFIRKESLSTIITLMAELESKNTNLAILKDLIYKIPELTKMIAEKANIFRKDDDFVLQDVDFAIKRLGIDMVKKVSSDYVKIEHDRSEMSDEDSSFDMLKTLKAVMLPKLSPFFGYKDQNGIANNIMNMETKGIEVLMAKGRKNMNAYYKDPSQIYSEMTRFLETMAYDKDLIQINHLYVHNFMKSLIELFDGYMLAYLCRNPHYGIDKKIKLNVNKINLSFGYIAYLIFMTAEAIIESKKTSINVLLNRLLKTGMDSDRLLTFMDNIVKEANSILKDIGRKGSIKTMSTTRTSVRTRDLFAKDPQSTTFVNNITRFTQTRRLIIRYEDEPYTHYILSKLIDSEDFSMYSSMFCVIPCENLVQDDMSLESFSYFGLVILKNFDRLSKNLLRSLLKLWGTFDGSIIMTFSTYGIFDYQMRDLFNFLNPYIVDFPSPFSDEKIYRKMVEQILSYTNPYSGNTDFTGAKYLQDILSMNQIRGTELLPKVQTAEPKPAAKKPPDEKTPPIVNRKPI
ncbi:MAG: hypothetical protein SFH39_01270 [Candidatus Magnetobacterium sp. LHC-1]|uniref:PilZ domain-containing protein n=1 Tax=Candidatus Magnetobacterium casense TaxID=1455061 RepID=A0ABS6S283_9BACT|nr:hypothetical protein [Candidatus Magnetobacterium casensis]MBF0605987.1 hypothetical protein [Nitrospirota bacterium]MBV6342503.1 hypothetical protein [Candidatus Magnetobacterium casensis]